MWCANGATNTRMRRSPTTWCSPSPGPQAPRRNARGIPNRVIHYQYRQGRARRTLGGIDEQVIKAQRAVDGHAPVKRNRYIQLTGATESVNRTLEAKTRALAAGWKGYTSNVVRQPATFASEAYHQLWHIENAVSLSKHDLRAHPDLPPQPRFD